MISSDPAKPPSGTDKVPSDFWLALRANVKRRRRVIPITPIPRDGSLELSYSQERLWFLDQRQPNSSVHQLLHIFYLEGSVNITVLENCLREIVQRHEVLRTTFPCVKGRPVPVISSEAMFELPVSDLQAFSPEQWTDKIRSLALEYADRPFDLALGPLWRFKLLQLGPNNYALIRVIHHIIFDGWSNSVFLRELDALYEAFTVGNPSPLADLPIQYIDFAHAQREWFKENLFSAQLDYWTNQFDRKASALELPIDYSRAIAQSERGKCQPVVLSESLTEALKTLSHQQGVSLFATLLAALKALLFCYTRQEDMIVCSPVASRQRNETKDLIGYFNNVVALRTDLSGNPSFQELLHRVSQVTLGAYENQDIPLQQVAMLPNLLRTPLTRVMFALQNIPNRSWSQQANGLKIRSEFIEREITNFDLSLLLQEVNGQIEGRLQYKSDLFAPSTIARLVEHFRSLLETLTQESKCHLSDLLLFEVAKASRKRCDDQARRLTPQPDLPELDVVPSDEFEQQLTQIWEEVLQINPIGRTSNFFDLGGHSLLAVQLFTKIEQSFDKNWPLSTLFQAPTIEKLADLLRQEERLTPWQSLVPIQVGGSNPPLFCMHGGGLNVLIFQSLATVLGPEQPIYGLQAKGLDGQADPHDRIEDIAADYIKEMQMVQAQGPYFLAGLSSGGIIGLEIAQQLNAQGETVAVLAMFDTYGPCSRQLLPIIRRCLSIANYGLRFMLPRFVKKIKLIGLRGAVNSLLSPKSSFTRSREIDNRPDIDSSMEVGNMIDGVANLSTRKGALEGLIEKLHLWVLQHSPMAFHSPSVVMTESPGVMTLNIRKLEEVHHQARIQYRPKAYFGHIAIFRANEQPPGFYLDPKFGWGQIAMGELSILSVPGHHSSITESLVLAMKLKTCLDKAHTNLPRQNNI
jgi:acyl carrier protein